MKICGIICEFNPFHNGHEYLLKEARKLSGCDAVVCIMSGNFTQRGDICVIDKHLRAKHAVLGGADCVIELPAPFSVAPAEIFAKGAVKLLSSIPELSTIAFGCEDGNEDDFLHAAEILNNESDVFKTALRNKLDEGESYIKSYAFAFEKIGGNTELLSKPNNTLGVEYAKSVLRTWKGIKLLPIKRFGAVYSDSEIKKNFSSASAIRRNISSPLVKDNVPSFVLKDLSEFAAEQARYEDYLKLILSRTSAESLSKIYGCGDGLENALKALQTLPFNQIIKEATSKRFSSSRIKRILCANFLNLYQADCEKYLSSDLYLSPLAVKKESANEILSALAKSPYPVLTCGSDEKKLCEEATRCKKQDDFAYLQWQQITARNAINKIVVVYKNKARADCPRRFIL